MNIQSRSLPNNFFNISFCITPWIKSRPLQIISIQQALSTFWKVNCPIVKINRKCDDPGNDEKQQTDRV